MKATNLSFISDLILYLETLNAYKSKYIITIFTEQDGIRLVNDDIDAKLVELGLATKLAGKSNFSYIGVIFENVLVFEKIDRNDITFDENIGNIRLKVVSRTFQSVIKADSFVGVSLNNVQVANNKRGLGIVVADPTNGQLIDSVVFDCNLERFPAYRPFYQEKDMLQRLTELQSGLGYTIAQYIVDRISRNIIIIVDCAFTELIRAVLAPILLNNNILIRGIYNTLPNNVNFKFVYTSYFVAQFIGIDKLAVNSLTDETILFVS